MKTPQKWYFLGCQRCSKQPEMHPSNPRRSKLYPATKPIQINKCSSPAPGRTKQEIPAFVQGY